MWRIEVSEDGRTWVPWHESFTTLKAAVYVYQELCEKWPGAVRMLEPNGAKIIFISPIPKESRRGI